jgi:hypothetical protein
VDEAIENSPLEEDVSEALRKLAVALSESKMSAQVVIHKANGGAPIEFSLGIDRRDSSSSRSRVRPASGEASHLDLGEI